MNTYIDSWPRFTEPFIALYTTSVFVIPTLLMY